MESFEITMSNIYAPLTRKAYYIKRENFDILFRTIIFDFFFSVMPNKIIDSENSTNIFYKYLINIYKIIKEIRKIVKQLLQ